MILSFPKLVKDLLAPLPQNDYPVLNTRLFVKFWLGFTLEQSLTSMRDLFQRLNHTGFPVDISTFSKANWQRSQKPFIQIYQKLCQLVNKKVLPRKLKNYLICPIDSTIITKTCKLLWLQGYHQVKLFSSLNLSSGVPEENLINFGYDHDYNYGQEMIDALPIWKFLKMHLKLDRLITKNLNGIAIQIYATLIAYLILPECLISPSSPVKSTDS